MKKIKRKRLELERDVVKVLMAAIPPANLKHVQGGTVEMVTVISCDVPCSYSCKADSCPSMDLC
jgi:hypothetical protein